jgi:chemotaxis protein histidine kinase CheA
VNKGTYISGALHLIAIVLTLFGGMFDDIDDNEFEVAEVSIVSSEEFAALNQPVEVPSPVLDVTAPQAPQQEPETDAPILPASEAPQETAEVAEPETPPDADVSPDLSEITPLPEVEVEPDVPITPSTPTTENVATLLPNLSQRPTPRDSERVAPTPAAQPEPDVEIADSVQDATEPDVPAEQVQEEQVATAPEKATTEIVPETTEPPSSAPLSSPRPASRPERPVRVAETTEEPASLDTSIETALNEANTSERAPTPAASVPSGPPLTRGEKDALRLAVGSCWSLGSSSTEAMRTTVVVGVEMSRDGKPQAATIRLIDSDGPNDSATQIAFSAARRAIIRCGTRGYNLPTDKYDSWRDIEITFNPERMRTR